MHVDQWKKILVLQTSFLGDTILSLPLLAEIKHRFPQMKLTLLCMLGMADSATDVPTIKSSSAVHEIKKATAMFARQSRFRRGLEEELVDLPI